LKLHAEKYLVLITVLPGGGLMNAAQNPPANPINLGSDANRNPNLNCCNRH
jgi:hypothetical protein